MKENEKTLRTVGRKVRGEREKYEREIER